jgi:hypothetical protein
MYDAVETVGGSAIVVIVIACIVCGYILHMWRVLRDIAQEEAREQADAMFNDYVQNCTYTVHTQLRIVDEMHKKSR